MIVVSAIDREADKTGRLIREAIWIRKNNNTSRDEGSYRLSHVCISCYLLTSETGSKSGWRYQVETQTTRVMCFRCDISTLQYMRWLIVVFVDAGVAPPSWILQTQVLRRCVVWALAALVNGGGRFTKEENDSIRFVAAEWPNCESVSTEAYISCKCKAIIRQRL